MKDEQKRMMLRLAKNEPPEPVQETFEQLLTGAVQNARGKKQKAVLMQALQLLKTTGEPSARNYLQQRSSVLAKAIKH